MTAALAPEFVAEPAALVSVVDYGAAYPDAYPSLWLLSLSLAVVQCFDIDLCHRSIFRSHYSQPYCPRQNAGHTVPTCNTL